MAQSTNWWNDAVFYEVFVRSFKDSDGDGKGDFKGLINKLDYLNDGNPDTRSDLGVNAIWLMPIQQSPSYHGYDVIDYRTVEQDYGTNQDFKDFIAAAHARGIKVIIDYVMNHTSSQHPWFQSSINPTSEKRDWYVWENSNPGNTGPWGQTVWQLKNNSYYYGIFWSEMPDLNYRTQEVKDEMFDIAKFWLEDMEVDGFRLDAVLYVVEDGTTLQNTPETIQFWKDFRTFYKSINPDAFAVGEAWTSTDVVKDYVNNNGLDYCFEFDLASAIVNAANYNNAGAVTALSDQVDEVIASYPSLQYGTFLTNHDMNRVMDQLGKNFSKAKLASDLLLTLPGVPYLYYGEEIGMSGSGVDENKRTPLQWNSSNRAGFTTGTPWRNVNSDYTTKNIESQQHDANSLWYHYRDLIAIRNSEAALRKGTYKSMTSSSATAFSFLRQYQDENVIVVSNTSASSVSNLQISLDQGGITQGNYVLVELQGGTSIPVSIDNTGSFTNLTIAQIPAQSTLIYRLLAPSEITTTVTFKIDMNMLIDGGFFNPATETVDIVADFNSFGADSIAVLKDPDNDGIYTLTVPEREIGSKINYKYRINGVNNGREEFAGTTFYRGYLVLNGTNVITDVYQSPFMTSARSALKASVEVYPVPTTNELFVEYNTDLSGTVQYQIKDLVGMEKSVSSFDTGNQFGVHSISCEGLPAGVYLLTLTNNGISETFRIVIQK